jgi:hypothetical protein
MYASRPIRVGKRKLDEINGGQKRSGAVSNKNLKVTVLTMVALVALIVVGGCARPTPEPTPTSTPILLTATPTPIPPTPTRACEVKCDVDFRGNLSIEITCESGSVNQTSTTSFRDGGIHITGQRTYQTSGNTYNFTAFIIAKEGAWKAKIEVTGGVFGEIPQTCEK